MKSIFMQDTCQFRGTQRHKSHPSSDANGRSHYARRDAYPMEQFLSGFEGDVMSLIWRIQQRVWGEARLHLPAERFWFGDWGTENSGEPYAWTFIEFKNAQSREACIVVSAIERGGKRLYSFDGVVLSFEAPNTQIGENLIEEVSLQENIERLVQLLAADVLRQLRTD